MRYRALGRTGYEVSEIGHGTWGIGKSMWSGTQDYQSLRALHEAVDLGVNFVDTALLYGHGHSEQLVGTLLKERREEIFVATKVPPKNRKWPGQGTLREAYPRDHILKCAETSLRNLQVDRIAILQLHVWNPSWLHETEWYETLLSLQDRGQIAHFGVSANDHQPDSVLELVKSGKVETIQVIYNIFDQGAEEKLFPLCRRNGVGVIARAPLDEGALTGQITPHTRFGRRDWRNRYLKGKRKQLVFDRVEKLRELVGAGVNTLPELALKFCLHPETVGTVLVGMRSRQHVRDNASVSERAPLSEQTLGKLREHRWEKNFYV